MSNCVIVHGLNKLDWLRNQKNNLDRKSMEVHRTGSLERKKNNHAQLLSNPDQHRQIRSVHLTRSTFSNVEYRQESGRSGLEGMVG